MEQYQFAGWWRRFGAYFLDAIVTIVVIGLIAVAITVIAGALGAFGHGPSASGGADSGSPALVMLLTLGGVFAALIFAIWYFPGAWARGGQTLGQQWLGIMVVRPDGRPVGFGRALLRYYIGMGILDNIVFGVPLGYLWAAFDARKQAWHDKIADTIVVRV
jgi:uncharacterized RDD family membrane protein YckC